MNRRRFLSAAASMTVLRGDTRRDVFSPATTRTNWGFASCGTTRSLRWTTARIDSPSVV